MVVVGECMTTRRDRYRADPEYRAKLLEEKRERYASNADYRDKCRANSRAQRLKDVKAFDRATSNRRTGWTNEGFERAWHEQHGRCGACSCQLLDVKHGDGVARDHYETLDGVRCKSGTKGAKKHPRGLLCVVCNIVLGYYESCPTDAAKYELVQKYLCKYRVQS